MRQGNALSQSVYTVYMLGKIHTYINKHLLLTKDKPVLVGLSGGADSVALLMALTQSGYHCIAAHCNFHLRKEESDRDEQFSENLARRLKIAFHKKDFDTEPYAKEKHISIEMAARELRYEWFEELRNQVNAQAIAVAHHKDDNAETVLLNLIRGTGIKGLKGMRPQNGYIVRPLLDIGKNEILEWLEEQQATYITDSTNQADTYTRNFIRLRIWPLLQEINPSVTDSIARTAEHVSAAEKIYQSVVDKAKETVMTENHCILIPELIKYPSAETILYELLIPYNFTRLVAGEIFLSLNKTSGKVFYSPTHRLIKDRDTLIITPDKEIKPTVFEWKSIEDEWEIPIELSANITVITKEFQIEKNKHTAYFDYDRLTFPLTLRTWRQGDWFIPFGMKGRKKVSDYFSDNKFSLADKEETWLLCNGDDIIWIVGERTDNRYKINKSTKRALVVNFSPKIQLDK